MAFIPKKIKTELLELKKRLNKKIAVEKMILFGSYAKGNFSENSDIDLCIIANNISNNFITTLSVAPIIAEIDSRIEPVVFSKKNYMEDSNFGLLKEIKKSGIEI